MIAVRLAAARVDLAHALQSRTHHARKTPKDDFVSGSRGKRKVHIEEKYSGHL